MASREYLTILLAASLMATTGCGKKVDNESSRLSASSASTGVFGTAILSGKVSLSGKAPAREVISMDSDSVCKTRQHGVVKDETVVTDAKGDLANVFVYVKDGAGPYPAPSAPVTLVQNCCMFIPRVFGLQINQPLVIINEDPTLHNVHCMAVTNDTFNIGQPTRDMKIETKFLKPEVLVKFKCDLHNWMRSYAGVVSNPFFTVTGADGTYRITRLPAGTYTLVAVHEKYGESLPQNVTLEDRESRTMNFAFTAQ